MSVVTLQLKTIILVAVVAAVCIGAGFAAGYFTTPEKLVIKEVTTEKEAANPFNKIIFTRTGAALFLKDQMDISLIKVFDARAARAN